LLGSRINALDLSKYVEDHNGTEVDQTEGQDGLGRELETSSLFGGVDKLVGVGSGGSSGGSSS
jgi:hypothetical protein